MNSKTRLRTAFAFLVALAGPILAQADTVYFSKSGSNGIHSLSGKIVKDTDLSVEIMTSNGQTVSIPKKDIFQIILSAPAEKESGESAPAVDPRALNESSSPPSTNAPYEVRSPIETNAPVEVRSPVETIAPTQSSTPIETAAPVQSSTPTDSGPAIETDPFKAMEATHTSAAKVDLDPAAPRSPRSGHYGIKGGMNSSNVSADPQDLEDHDSLRSFAVGAWWGLPLNRRLTFRTEALYSVKGDAESAGGYTASTRMTYLDVPVLAKIGFLHDSSFQPSLFLGPALALNISAKSTLVGDGNETEVDVKDQIRPLDLGLVLGGGVDFPIGGRTYGVELRYSKGLSNAAGEEANGSARNDVIAVMGSIGLR